MFGFPGRDDGWRNVHREYGAEAVRRKILHDRYIYAIRRAYGMWLTLSVCMGMGGTVSWDNGKEVKQAIEYAAACKDTWLESLS